jgi:glycosyltransferase involved in cell wall biosynthesis
MFNAILTPCSFRQFQRKPIRLSMNLLVKNEADIIEDNIRFHASQGVDCFVVMDNGSKDGTREIVNSLKQEFDIYLIDRPIQDYQQSNWKSEMAFASRKHLNADWSIANDADEFWFSDSGNLKDELSHWGSIVECKRVNMLSDENFYTDGYDYLDSPYKVCLPIFNRDANLIEDNDLSIQLGKISGKVMVNNHGLIRVKGGNHRAWHWWSGINQRITPSITVYHYPIRSKQHFVEHIKHRSALLASGVKKMGDHYRRWVRLYDAGQIDEELDRLVIRQEDAKVLEKFGIIKEDLSIGKYIKKALNR